MVRTDVIEGLSVDNGGTVQKISAFGEREIVESKVFNMKIGDPRHGDVPITHAVSKNWLMTVPLLETGVVSPMLDTSMGTTSICDVDLPVKVMGMMPEVNVIKNELALTCAFRNGILLNPS
ncbi:hypothetical protein TNIN_113601 [Trichonephila inaurata madagascariensis]|uniref:Uncharacterized protein n=1 Tax=Trichonephila inaurata madagascariensis TaxID=2747483 RepID=A0A8X7CG31_9ARAC|nr:hypothetical protein TNIN_113601 [Trichonephila inaurata madagascariensis]